MESRGILANIIKRKLRLISLILVASFFPFSAFSQSGSVTISQTVPPTVTVCQPSNFSIVVTNLTAGTLSGLTLNAAMPGGMNYVVGSVASTPVGITEQNISNLESPVFALPNLPATSGFTVTFTAIPTCGIIAYQAGGSPVVNTAIVTYPNASTDQNTSSSYNTGGIKIPSLVITTFTNQSYTGTVGSTFTRSITITNSGIGSLSSFTLTDVHGAGINITNVSPGVLGGTATNDTITVSGANFTSIGNNNALFETGESITITETVDILSCSGLASNISVYWGCTQPCQTALTTANVVVPSGAPILTFKETQSTETCLDPSVARIEQLRIINTGTGPATNVLLTIFSQVNNLTETNCGRSTLDVNSFTWQLGNGAAAALVPTKTYSACNTYTACTGPNPISKADLTLPITINPGDTVYLTWEDHTCCNSSNACTGGSGQFSGWSYRGTYENGCGSNTYTIPTTVLSGVKSFYLTLFPDNMPTDMLSGQTATFAYGVQLWSVGAFAPGAYYKIEITLPPCLTLAAVANPVRFVSQPSGTIWTPTSSSMSGNVLTAIFALPSPPGFLKNSDASFLFDLTDNCTCSGPGPSPDPGCGANPISINVTYNPNPACPAQCLKQLYCNTTSINAHCPCCTSPGIVFLNYKIQRTNYGKPDNNNDGLPEAGTVNLNAIRTDRAMYGDTLTGFFRGKIITNLAYPSFAYCYASSSVSVIGNYITSIGASVTIYDASTASYINCGNVPPSSVVPGATYKAYYDLSPSYLNANGCGIPAGFVFENGDSVLLSTRFRVSGNPSPNMYAPPKIGIVSNTFYASDIVNPSPGADPAHRFMCDNWSGSITLFGHAYFSWAPESYNVSSCNIVTVNNTNYFMVGPWSANHGSNNFPFEYRQQARIDTIKVVKPAGYSYVSATIVGGAACCGVVHPSTSINPINPLSDTLVFNIGALFASGAWPDYSFDGYYSTISVSLQPTCSTPNATKELITYIETHKQFAQLGGGSYTYQPVVRDTVIYAAPNIALQSALQTVNGVNAIEHWDVIVNNLANNSSASNTWLSLQSLSGKITVLNVIDVATSATVTPVGGIYQLGTFLFNSSKTYRIEFKYNTCDFDSLLVLAGWNCTGYPPTVAAYPCIPDSLTLYLDPQPSELQLQVFGPLSGSTNICDTTSYEVVLNSVQLAACYNLLVNANLPAGLTVVPGTSQAIYPTTSSWFSIPDPVGNQWDLSAYIALIGANGLQGINSTTFDQVKIRFKVRTDCSFKSGGVVTFSSSGISSCGKNLPVLYSTSGPLGINGSQPANNITMTVVADTIRPCSGPSLVTVTMVNLGPDTLNGTEHFYFSTTAGSSYSPNSFTGIKNPPPIGTPTVSTISGANYLDWNLPSGVAVFDTVRFSFKLNVNPDSVNCISKPFKFKSVNEFQAICVANGSVCNVAVVTKSDSITIPIGKPCLSLNALTATSTPTATGENIVVGYSVYNSCSDKATGIPVVVSFYFDNDNSGTYTTGDSLIGTHTTTDSILTNTGNAYSGVNLFANSVYSCNILAVLDTFACSCTDAVVTVNLPLLNAGPDTTICSGDSVKLGVVYTQGYTYSWSPTTGLSNPSSATPTVYLLNTTSTSITQQYVVTTNRGGCVSTDTVLVTIRERVIADFSAPNVCFNNQTVFTDQSPQNPVQWNWNFGDGNTATSQNPTHTYVAAGTYTTTLVVTNAFGCKDSIKKNIIVLPLPNAAFAAPPVCIGNVTLFTDSSSITNGNLLSWSWNFGDPGSGANNTSLLQHPTHQYALPGVYSVFLTVTSDSGCQSTSTLPVTVYGLPVTNFTATTPCLNSSSQLTDSSVSVVNDPIVSWSWNMPNATPATATVQNPNVLYQTAGSHTVTLIVVTQSGCTDTLTKPVLVYNNPIANFGSPAEGCPPVCNTFIDSSTSVDGAISSWSWSFPGGAPSASVIQNPTICYNTAGTYGATLIVTTSYGCKDTITISPLIDVHPLPAADFCVTPKQASAIDPTFVFCPLWSTDVTSWVWDFGDGSGMDSTNTNPIHSYSAVVTNNSFYSFNICINVSNQYGCIDTICKEVEILPEFSFYIPNTFTPNGDGKNEFFFGKSRGVKEYHIWLFDRWGNQIWDCHYSGNNTDWDNLNQDGLSSSCKWDGVVVPGGVDMNGNSGLIAQQDVYIWKVDLVDIFEKRHNYIGHVNVVR